MLGGVAHFWWSPRREVPLRRLPRLRVAVLAAAVLLGAAAPPGLAQAGDPVTVVQAFRAAIAAQDSEAVLAVWADDGVYLITDHNDAIPLGREALRQRLPAVFAADQRIAVGAFRVADDLVTYDWRATLDPAVGRDLPALEGTDEVVVRNGKISRWTRRPDPAAAERQRLALHAMLAARAAQRDHASRATAVAASGVLQRTPDTQGRRTPSPVLWAVGAGAILLVTGLAALTRSRTPP
jgi:hypothetical protein